jgi:hypothetical protein
MRRDKDLHNVTIDSILAGLNKPASKQQAIENGGVLERIGKAEKKLIRKIKKVQKSIQSLQNIKGGLGA